MTTRPSASCAPPSGFSTSLGWPDDGPAPAELTAEEARSCLRPLGSSSRTASIPTRTRAGASPGARPISSPNEAAPWSGCSSGWSALRADRADRAVPAAPRGPSRERAERSDGRHGRPAVRGRGGGPGHPQHRAGGAGAAVEHGLDRVVDVVERRTRRARPASCRGGAARRPPRGRGGCRRSSRATVEPAQHRLEDRQRACGSRPAGPTQPGGRRARASRRPARTARG